MVTFFDRGKIFFTKSFVLLKSLVSLNNKRNKQQQQQQKTKNKMTTTTTNNKVTAKDIFAISSIVCLIVTISVTIASVA